MQEVFYEAEDSHATYLSRHKLPFSRFQLPDSNNSQQQETAPGRLKGVSFSEWNRRVFWSWLLPCQIKIIYFSRGFSFNYFLPLVILLPMLLLYPYILYLLALMGLCLAALHYQPHLAQDFYSTSPLCQILPKVIRILSTEQTAQRLSRHKEDQGRLKQVYKMLLILSEDIIPHPKPQTRQLDQLYGKVLKQRRWRIGQVELLARSSSMFSLKLWYCTHRTLSFFTKERRVMSWMVNFAQHTPVSQEGRDPFYTRLHHLSLLSFKMVDRLGQSGALDPPLLRCIERTTAQLLDCIQLKLASVSHKVVPKEAHVQPSQIPNEQHQNGEEEQSLQQQSLQQQEEMVIYQDGSEYPAYPNKGVANPIANELAEKFGEKSHRRRVVRVERQEEGRSGQLVCAGRVPKDLLAELKQRAIMKGLD